jgi:hypothetical protein
MVRRAKGEEKRGGGYEYLKSGEIYGLLRYMTCREGRNEIVDG